MVRAKFELTAGRHKAEFFEEFMRKIAASLKDFQRSAGVSSPPSIRKFAGSRTSRKMMTNTGTIWGEIYLAHG
jgi:hypothetical protein